MNKIKELRKKQGISQKELARQVNVAQNTISRWESGERVVDADSLKKLAEFFGVSSDYLLEINSTQILIENGAFDYAGDPPARLKKLRIQKNMSQKELANELGIKQNTISQWESGKRIMSAEMLKVVAGYFKVSTDYLLGIPTSSDDLSPDQEKPIIDDGLSDNKKALLDFAETIPEDKAAMILQVIKSIVEADQ